MTRTEILPAELHELRELVKDLLHALELNMEWIGPPPVGKYDYDSFRELAWDRGNKARRRYTGYMLKYGVIVKIEPITQENKDARP